MSNNPVSVRISDETLKILKKYYPSINLPAQIAQAIHDLDILKTEEQSRKLSPAIWEQIMAHGKKESEKP